VLDCSCVNICVRHVADTAGWILSKAKCRRDVVGLSDCHTSIPEKTIDSLLLIVLQECLLTYSMEQSPLEKLTGLQLVKKFPAFLWNPKVHYSIHNCSPPVSILSQPNPVHTPTSHFWRSFLILSSHLRLGLPSGVLPSGLPIQTRVFTEKKVSRIVVRVVRKMSKHDCLLRRVWLCFHPSVEVEQLSSHFEITKFWLKSNDNDGYFT
jgi:hypothetical protein